MSNSLKFLLVFLFSQNCFFGQESTKYSFDTFLVGKINNTHIDDIGESFVIQNSSDISYILNIIQYDKGNKSAILFDEKNKKRIFFEFDFKFSKIQDIKRLVKKNVDSFKNYRTKTDKKDSISYEKDTIKNELIVRSFNYKKNKINIFKDFIYIYSNADSLLLDDKFKSILKNNNEFLHNCYNKEIKKKLNITGNKIYVEVKYISFEQFKNKVILNE